jgi:hypothetical protein
MMGVVARHQALSFPLEYFISFMNDTFRSALLDHLRCNVSYVQSYCRLRKSMMTVVLFFVMLFLFISDVFFHYW